LRGGTVWNRPATEHGRGSARTASVPRMVRSKNRRPWQERMEGYGCWSTWMTCPSAGGPGHRTSGGGACPSFGKRGRRRPDFRCRLPAGRRPSPSEPSSYRSSVTSNRTRYDVYSRRTRRGPRSFAIRTTQRRSVF
jgi:hypothetical protein